MEDLQSGSETSEETDVPDAVWDADINIIQEEFELLFGELNGVARNQKKEEGHISTFF